MHFFNNVHKSNFWDAFLGSNFSINFLISSALIFLTLIVSDFFLLLINFILRWFRYFLMTFKTGPFYDESKLTYVYFYPPGEYMFMKYSWNIPVIYSRNIRRKFPNNVLIEYRNIPWMFHEYPTNFTSIFLDESRNTITVFSSG